MKRPKHEVVRDFERKNAAFIIDGRQHDCDCWCSTCWDKALNRLVSETAKTLGELEAAHDSV